MLGLASQLMQKRNVLNSPRLSELKRKKRKIFIRKILIFVFGFLIIIVALSYVSRIKRLNISEVDITGNNIIDTHLLKTTVEKEIFGDYLWIFPKTNILFYPKNRIKNELSNQFKRLKDITLNIKDRQILEISVTERSGKYIWCGETVNLESKPQIEKCYFLDDEGYIFDEAPYFSGEVYFKFYGYVDLTDGLPTGSYFFKENFKNVILFKQMLEGTDVKPVAFYMQKNGDIKMLLSKENKLPANPEIRFKTNADLEKVVENLKVALDTEPLKSEFKTKYSSLLYIDLRFGNKVYYKFK